MFGKQKNKMKSFDENLILWWGKSGKAKQNQTKPNKGEERKPKKGESALLPILSPAEQKTNKKHLKKCFLVWFFFSGCNSNTHTLALSLSLYRSCSIAGVQSVSWPVITNSKATGKKQKERVNRKTVKQTAGEGRRGKWKWPNVLVERPKLVEKGPGKDENTSGQMKTIEAGQTKFRTSLRQVAALWLGKLNERVSFRQKHEIEERGHATGEQLLMSVSMKVGRQNRVSFKSVAIAFQKGGLRNGQWKDDEFLFRFDGQEQRKHFFQLFEHFLLLPCLDISRLIGDDQQCKDKHGDAVDQPHGDRRERIKGWFLVPCRHWLAVGRMTCVLMVSLQANRCPTWVEECARVVTVDDAQGQFKMILKKIRWSELQKTRSQKKIRSKIRFRVKQQSRQANE